MKISVCLIARNEEEVIGRCLESISVFADEIMNKLRKILTLRKMCD